MPIQDIPNSSEFFYMGVEHIMIGYDGIIELSDPLIKYMEYEDPEGEVEFWESARLKLLVYTGLIHEGFDFILKSKICDVNPLLLIKNNPKELRNKKSFSDCLTHNSSDLPDIVNSFCTKPLDKRFLELFELGRNRRNKIRHSVDKNLKVQAEEIIKETLEMFSFVSPKKWVEVRLQYAEEDEVLNLYAAEIDFYRGKLVKEFIVLDNLLKPDFFKKHFGVDKNQERFLCFDCVNLDYVEEVETAYLIKKDNQKFTKCMICDNEDKIAPNDFDHEGCECKYYSVEHGQCICCGGSVPPVFSNKI